MVERIGIAALKGVLDDLAGGMLLNEALPHRTKMSLEQIDGDFAQFARQRAEKVAPDLTWEEPDLPADADSAALTAWLEKHPKSFAGRRRLGARLVVEQRWTRAKEVLEKLKGAYPEYVGSENAYLLLAAVYRRLSDPSAERRILEELANLDGSASPAYLRLSELALAAHDWAGLAKNARRLLAVNPLIPAPHRFLARAAEESGQRDEAITAYRALALLDDTDAAGIHYHLARLLYDSGKPRDARREVLRSLEEAPRYRDAHRLLLEIVDRDPSAAAASRSAPAPKVTSP
jgi:tetratricopeptide (TPR) repeat protein